MEPLRLTLCKLTPGLRAKKGWAENLITRRRVENYLPIWPAPSDLLALSWCWRHRTRHNRTPPYKPIVFVVFLVLLFFCSLLFALTVSSTPNKSQSSESLQVRSRVVSFAAVFWDFKRPPPPPPVCEKKKWTIAYISFRNTHLRVLFIIHASSFVYFSDNHPRTAKNNKIKLEFVIDRRSYTHTYLSPQFKYMILHIFIYKIKLINKII